MVASTYVVSAGRETDAKREMSRTSVSVASLGGTITMTSAREDGQGGVRPSLTAEDLISAVPSLAAVAEVKATTLLTAPGASITFSDVLNLVTWACDEVAAGAAGVVLIQGTDTIEETAYLLDLCWDSDAPVVVTGAMRSPQIPGADGPGNLVGAVRVAAARESRGRGALVVMNDVIHPARRVRKVHTHLVNAFESSSFGPYGYLVEGVPVLAPATPRERALSLPEEFSVPRIALLETHLGDDGDVLASLCESHTIDGVVIAGFGVGHVSHALADAIEKAVSIMPVVLATRTGAGPVHAATYNFEGSESDLIDRGVIPSGWLGPRKARILLTCLVGAGSNVAQIHEEFERRGAEV